MKQKVCVIGCGWLGFPLAQTLIENNYVVHGSTTRKENIERLTKAKIHPFLIHFSPEGITGDIEACLSDCQSLILNIPPGLRKDPTRNYVQKLKRLIPYIESSDIEQVLFIGSTSVYDDDEAIPLITETSPTSTSKIAMQLLAVEALFQNNKHFDTTVLRFSGLFNTDRHPAIYLSGKTQLKNADAPVNLIHRDDCIAIIISILQQSIWNNVFNASTTSHPTRKTYYTKACKALNIPLPEFRKTQISKGKIIDSTKLVQILNYDFQIKL